MQLKLKMLTFWRNLGASVCSEEEVTQKKVPVFQEWLLPASSELPIIGMLLRCRMMIAILSKHCKKEMLSNTLIYF